MANIKCKNQKLRWDECCAKLVLESVFPNRFSQLVIRDKPDLQNDSLDVGIEVTSAVPPIIKENDSLFSRLTFQNPTTEQKERSLNRVRYLGGQYYDEGYMFSWAGERNISEVYAAYNNKLTKLNSGGYAPFSNQYLFLTERDIIIYPNNLNEIHNEFSRRQTQFLTGFNSVFLNLDYSLLIEFDMISHKHYQYNFEDFEALADMAFHMANDTIQ